MMVRWSSFSLLPGKDKYEQDRSVSALERMGFNEDGRLDDEEENGDDVGGGNVENDAVAVSAGIIYFDYKRNKNIGQTDSDSDVIG